ncbi:MAG: hypothetical protein ACTSU5_01530 [Promethearchaeota archaeon]
MKEANPGVNGADPEVLDLVREFNDLMREGVVGPNCVAKGACDPVHNCCSIHIDVPRALVDLYLSRGELGEDQIIRRGPFGFELGVDPESIKCVLLDQSTGGCRLHSTGLKPPQCWIYPTGFDGGRKTCKMGHAWDFPDDRARERARELFERYNEIASRQGSEEWRRVAAWFDDERILRAFQATLTRTPPREVAGICLSFRTLEVLPSEGSSLSLKRFCDELRPNCDEVFLECPSTCSDVARAVVEYTRNRVKALVLAGSFRESFSFFDMGKQ